MRRKRWLIPAVAAASLVATMLVPSASADTPPPASDFAGDDFYYDHHAQHGPASGHLAGSSDNVDLVGKLRLTSQEGDISDVSALGSFAYVGD